VKTTLYFQHVRTRPDRATIRDEWISHVVEQAERTEVQSDGRIRKWARIAETGKFLRVICWTMARPCTMRSSTGRTRRATNESQVLPGHGHRPHGVHR
jgi:hypothetical protein